MYTREHCNCSLYNLVVSPSGRCAVKTAAAVGGRPPLFRVLDASDTEITHLPYRA